MGGAVAEPAAQHHGLVERDPEHVTDTHDELLKVWPIAPDSGPFIHAMDDDHGNDDGEQRKLTRSTGLTADTMHARQSDPPGCLYRGVNGSGSPMPAPTLAAKG
jgi:hypothetical protein